MLGAATGATPTVIGTGSTGADGGAVFGIDTFLYRSGADVLRCNQLDQTVPPVKAFNKSGALSGTVSSGTSTFACLDAFTMPFKGDLTLTAWVNVQATGSGVLLVGALGASMAGGVNPTNAPQAIQRMHAPAGESVWVALPVFAVWANLAANAAMAPAITVAHGGGQNFTLSYFMATAIATRTL